MIKQAKEKSPKGTGVLVVILWLVISACGGSTCNVSTSPQSGEVTNNNNEKQSFTYNRGEIYKQFIPV